MNGVRLQSYSAWKEEPVKDSLTRRGVILTESLDISYAQE
jgi:hypothetical protein